MHQGEPHTERWPERWRHERAARKVRTPRDEHERMPARSATGTSASRATARRARAHARTQRDAHERMPRDSHERKPRDSHERTPRVGECKR